MNLLAPDKKMPKRTFFEPDIFTHKFIMFKVMRDKLDSAVREQTVGHTHYSLVRVMVSTEYFHSTHPLMFTITLTVRDSL